MDRKIILRIKIDGKNWNELINLPCVQELTKGDERIYFGQDNDLSCLLSKGEVALKDRCLEHRGGY